MPFRRNRRTKGTPIDLDEGYELWAQTYDEEARRPLPRIEHAALTPLLPDVAGLEVVDLACGTGRYAEMLRARGARRVVCLDRSPRMLRILRDKRLGLPLVRGDLRSLPLADGSADGAVCALAYGHLVEIPQALTEVARILRPGGWLVFSDFHPAAVEAGLSRSFEVGGATYVLPHHSRSLADYERELAAAGLVVSESRAATAADEPEAFGGTRRLKERERDLPLILAIVARRT